MKKKTLRALSAALMLGFVAAGAAWAAGGLELSDLMGAAGGVSEPLPQKDETFGGLPVLEALDLPTAMKKIAEQGVCGVDVVRTGSGLGFVATGGGVYERFDDINKTRVAIRHAYTVALMDAKARLAKALHGIPVEAKRELSSINADAIGEDATKKRSSSQSSEELNEHLEAMIDGYVTHSVSDDGRDTVYVRIMTTPVTRNRIRAISGAVLSAEDLSAGVAQVVNDINKNVTPPSGAKLIAVPGTQEKMILSFGSSIVLQDADGTFRGRDRLTAQRRAQIDADAAMISFLQGDQILWRYGTKSQSSQSSSNYEESVKDGAKVETMLEKTRSSFIHAQNDSFAASSVTQGTLPKGVGSKSFFTEDGWCFVVNFYRPEMTWEIERTAPAPEAPKPAVTEETAPHAQTAPSESLTVSTPSASSAETPAPDQTEHEQPAAPKGNVDLAQLQKDYAEMCSMLIDPSMKTVSQLGEGVAPKNMSRVQARLMARRAALQDLYRNFAEYLQGAAVKSETLGKDSMVLSDSIRSSVEATVRGVSVVREEWNKDLGIFTVVGQLKTEEVEKYLKGLKHNRPRRGKKQD